MLSRLPPVTRALLVANVALFLLQLLMGPATFDPFMLWPPSAMGFDPFSPGQNFQPWQLLTYGFLHGGFGHLLFNMLALYMFGAPLELTWGARRFLAYYLICVAGAGLCQLAVGWWSVSQGGPAYPTVGASGGVFGLLLAYGMLFPNQQVMLLFPPIPMKARTFVIVFGAITLLLGFTGWQPGVAHFAHLGGMLFGWLVIRYWRGQPPFGGRRPPRGGPHLRRVK
ncbi:MAG TPA: rhomboid family intramembrane serine protease [Pseudoxanthomonas sp.]|nr:rhomboid family intramembrane serine protease [Pseudoxanthomonas sp.]